MPCRTTAQLLVGLLNLQLVPDGPPRMQHVATRQQAVKNFLALLGNKTPVMPGGLSYGQAADKELQERYGLSLMHIK